MTASREAERSEAAHVAAVAVFAHDTWNSPEWMVRHRAMTPGERVELAVAISRAALRFAHARRVARDGR